MLRSSILTLSLLLIPAHAQLGLFSNHTDVGTVLHAGSVDYNPSTHTYSVGGSGENMWFATDDFQFVWTKMSGDVTLSARLAILDKDGDPHRKAVLMIRQSLDSDAAYADAALHGDGLTSLQFRAAKGDVTHEIESNVPGPQRLRIEKRGDTFTLWVGDESGSYRHRSKVHDFITLPRSCLHWNRARRRFLLISARAFQSSVARRGRRQNLRPRTG